MNFQLTEEQLQVQKTVREFAETKILPGVLHTDATSEFPVELYHEMGKLGLIGLPYPKEYGGSGGDYLSYILAVEEVSKVDGSIGIAYSVSTSLYSGSCDNGCTEEQKKEWMPEVLSGQKFGSFGLTEPCAGSDAAGAIVTAKKDGDQYIINGIKCFITNGPLSDHFIVYALTQPELKTKGLSAFHVTKGTPGFSIGKIEDKMGIRSAAVSELVFENCAIPASALVGGVEGKGFALAMKTLDGGRIGVGAQGLGIGEGAYEIARKYLMTREQFGKPLYKQQYLAFKMAELKIELEQAQLLLYRAAMDKQEHRPYTISAAMAKYACTNAGMHVSTEAVQMLGGNGFMKEYHVERCMRDAKITQIYEGTNEIQKLIVSGTLFR